MILENVALPLYKLLGRIVQRRIDVKCSIVKPGVYLCRDGYDDYLLALYTIINNVYRGDMDREEAVYILRKFLNNVYVHGCRESILTSMEPIDRDRYLAEVDRKLQMKLVELELDKTNTRLRTEIEKIMNVKKRILQNIPPLRVDNTLILICRAGDTKLEEIEKIPRNLKNSMGIDLKPLTKPSLASYIANFRFKEES